VNGWTGWSKGNGELWYFGRHFYTKIDWLHSPYFFIGRRRHLGGGKYAILWVCHIGIKGVRRVGRKA